MTARAVRAALYARVSTTGQDPAGQLEALRAFASARGWTATEYVDHGISGMKERRPALDRLVAAVRGRAVDVVAVVKLDRLARSVHHLLSLGREFQALGVDLVALDQSLDTTTPSGRLLFTVLAAVAEFERDLIRERVMAGQARARARGVRFGRPRRAVDLAEVRRRREAGQSWRRIAVALRVPARTLRGRCGRGKSVPAGIAPAGMASPSGDGCLVPPGAPLARS